MKLTIRQLSPTITAHSENRFAGYARDGAHGSEHVGPALKGKCHSGQEWEKMTAIWKR